MQTASTAPAGFADAFTCSGNSPTVPFELGGHTLAVHYRLIGNPAGRLVVVLGGISADRRAHAAPGEAPGWWQSQVGPGCAIDTDRDAVLSFDWLGTDNGTGDHRRLSGVTTADQARALAAILEAIGRPRIDLLVGASYGGMVGLAFASAFPDRCGQLLLLCAAHRPHPMATAWRSLQRRIVALGRESSRPADALALARELAMTTYRSAREFEARFADGDAANDYLRARGRDFAGRFDAQTYLVLSASIDAHRVDPATVRTPATLIAFDNDTLVPPWLIEELRDRLGGPVRYRCLSASTGHDAFLTEVEAVGEVLRDTLDDAYPIVRPATRAARAAVGTDPQHGAVMPPLYLSSTFTLEGLGRKRAHDYSRTSNPTRDQLADILADLEGGAGAVITSSGMAAVALVLQLLRPEDRLLLTHDCYGGTHRLVRAWHERGKLLASFADLTGADAGDIVRREQPRLVWVETPSNPLLRITDLATVAAAAHEVGALLAVDNTLLSPACQLPIEHGADLVVHSTTKFLNGHSDVVGGAAIAADRALAGELAWWANCLGVTGAPFDSYLTLRGVRTLHARTRVHEDNARRLADLLNQHEAVEQVHYPGLADHSGHALAVRQQRGFGALLSFRLHGGEPAVRAFLRDLRHISLAVSLGGVESLVAHPASMTHAAMTAEQRQAAGIDDDLLRLSVGIEDVEDLELDLTAALARAARAVR